MRVLVCGRNGQLGGELGRCVPTDVSLVAFSSSELDISDRVAVDRVVGEVSPQVIINAAAYTAVDRAESEPDAAMAVNRDGAVNLARSANARGAFIVHISTDFVFAGDIARPLRPDDPLSPRNVYGLSKAEGERAIRDIIPDDSLIIRTSWLYSSSGTNFVKTILRMAGERDLLTVVADQVGSPTWAAGLARAIWLAVKKGMDGVYHYADAGVASWYDLACAVTEEAFRLGIIDKKVQVVPVSTEAYPTPAIRPFYSVLDSSEFYRGLGGKPVHWRDNLQKCLMELTGE